MSPASINRIDCIGDLAPLASCLSSRGGSLSRQEIAKDSRPVGLKLEANRIHSGSNG